MGEGVGEGVGVSERPHLAWARVLVVVGVAIALASAVVGYVWLQRMPELQPVDFGQRVPVVATETTSVTIFVSTGLSSPPSCKVTTGNGGAVTVGEAERYHQGGGLESAFGFPVASGTTYVVTCSSAAEAGRFAVAQDVAVPVNVLIATGSLGLALCGVGLVVTTGRRRATNTRTSSTR
jgi:hypothetical protein